MLPLCSLGAPVSKRSAGSDVPELQDIKDGVAVFASVIDSVVSGNTKVLSQLTVQRDCISVPLDSFLLIHHFSLLLQYLQGISGVPNLLEAIDNICILAKDVRNFPPNSTQSDNSSDIVLAVITELKQYSCKWVRTLASSCFCFSVREF